MCNECMHACMYNSLNARWQKRSKQKQVNKAEDSKMLEKGGKRKKREGRADILRELRMDSKEGEKREQKKKTVDYKCSPATPPNGDALFF